MKASGVYKGHKGEPVAQALCCGGRKIIIKPTKCNVYQNIIREEALGMTDGGKLIGFGVSMLDLCCARID